jgi:hypothetical protein
VITGLGVSVGFHRLLTHRSFTAVPALRVALAIAGSTNFEGDTWSVNSLCHVFGTRPFATRRHDRATNLWPLALISFGESWHNMHHSDPAPGDVLQHGDADQSRPQQGGKGGAPGAASEPPGTERQREGHRAQGGERGRDHPHGGIGQHVRGVPGRPGGGVAQQPARVGMREPAELPGHAVAVAVGGMRVAGPVGEGMMVAADGHPADHLPFEVIDPAIASATRSAGTAVKLRWVRSR